MTTLTLEKHPLATHTLEEAVEALAWVEESSSPMISLYLCLDQPGANLAKAERLALEVIRNMSRSAREDGLALLKKVEKELGKLPREEDLSLAFFFRGGDQPVKLSVVIPGRMTTAIHLDRIPRIFELVERKDVYHRYAVVNLTSTSARILQVNAGQITESLLAGNLDLRSRLSREISRERYHHHQKDRGQRFFKEKVKILESIVREDEFDHIILAGEPRLTSSFRKMLPKSLSDKVLDESVQGRLKDFDAILRASMDAFMKEEEKESAETLDRWKHSMATGGLAIAGQQEISRALERGNLDLLLISKQIPHAIADPISLEAVQNKVTIETVDDDDLLLNHQGLAGFLRYRETHAH